MDSPSRVWYAWTNGFQDECEKSIEKKKRRELHNRVPRRSVFIFLPTRVYRRNGLTPSTSLLRFSSCTHEFIHSRGDERFFAHASTTSISPHGRKRTAMLLLFSTWTHLHRTLLCRKALTREPFVLIIVWKKIKWSLESSWWDLLLRPERQNIREH